MVLSRQLETNYLLKSSGNSFGTNWRIYCSFQQCMTKYGNQCQGVHLVKPILLRKRVIQGHCKKDHQAWWQFRPENLQITDCLNTVRASMEGSASYSASLGKYGKKGNRQYKSLSFLSGDDDRRRISCHSKNVQFHPIEITESQNHLGKDL